MLLDYLILVVLLINCSAEKIFCEHDEIWSYFSSNQTLDLKKKPTRKPEIKLAVDILTLFNLEQKDGTIDMKLHVQVIWQDPRLNFSCNHQPFDMSDEQQKTMWMPKVGVTSSLGTKIQIMLTGDEKLTTTLTPGGWLYLVTTFTMTAPCQMNFIAFPFDSLRCDIAFDVFPYEMLTLAHVMFRKEFDYMGTHAVTSVDQSFEAIKNAIGGRDILNPVVSIVLKRFSTMYVFQCLIPMTLTCIIAWFGFFIDPKFMPARATILVSSLIALACQYNNVVQSIPKVGYVKIVDIWMLSLSLFIFVALAQFALVSYLSRKYDHYTGKDRKRLVKMLLNVDLAVGTVYILLFFILSGVLYGLANYVGRESVPPIRYTNVTGYLKVLK